MVENVIQIKSGMMINADASVKNITYVKKIIFGILLHGKYCKKGKYLASAIGNLVITCDEIVEETKTVSTNFYEEI